MADRAPGAGSGCVIVIYNNMIVMTPVFVLFCVVVLLVVPQQMNRLPCLSKIPYLRVKQNSVSPFKHRGRMYVLLCAVFVFILWGQYHAVRDRWLHFPKAEYVMNRMAVETRQASVELGYCYSDLSRVSFFRICTDRTMFHGLWVYVCLNLSTPWLSAGRFSLVVYFRGKLQIQFAGWWKLLAGRI